jgi:hypothetical protein
MANDRRGDHSVATKRDAVSESRERQRRGGGGYDAGPGREGMPGASDMDKPASPCGAYGRIGSTRRDTDRESRRIQDQRGNGRNY